MNPHHLHAAQTCGTVTFQAIETKIHDISTLSPWPKETVSRLRERFCRQHCVSYFVLLPPHAYPDVMRELVAIEKTAIFLQHFTDPVPESVPDPLTLH